MSKMNFGLIAVIHNLDQYIVCYLEILGKEKRTADC